MKKILTTLITLGTIFSISACSNTSALKSFKQLRNPEGLNHEYQWSDTNTDEYKLFKNKVLSLSARLSESFANREYEDNKNISFSPLSIELCLGLAIRSSSGETRKELLDLFDMDYETFNLYYKLLFNELSMEKYSEYKELSAQILLTNSIWIDDEVELLDSGLDALRDDYYCYSYEADFNKNNEKSCDAIKEFISEKTKGLIKPKLELPIETLFVLMNTLYLKDIWNDAGDELNEASPKYTFTNHDGKVSNKRLLVGNYVTGRVMETQDYSAFKTATSHGINLYFIKPNESKNIRDMFDKSTIEYALDSNNYVYVDDEKEEAYFTNCVFPEFKGECDIDLQKMFIEDLNVHTLFDDGKCDFSNLSRNPVYCSEFKHIAKLDVNKKGIEGAAVTYMAMCGSAAPLYKEVYETFVVDKEFGYILTYKDAVLFSGITTNID